MGIRLNQLFIYKPSPPNSLCDFVEFWSERYYDPYERLYETNINSPNSPEGLRDLFKWKFGSRFYAAKRPRIERFFIDRRDEARQLLRDLASHEFRNIAEVFLERFSDGGAIYRIFWLHCWDTRFPIHDQHVHRAMTFIEDGEGQELSRCPEQKQIQLYLDRYLLFFKLFKGMSGRKVDQALWQFGKSLKDSSLPRLRKR